MKKLLLFLTMAILLMGIGYASELTYYINQSQADDLGDGLSPVNAKKTITGLNALGDAVANQTILFARGETWRLSEDQYPTLWSGNTSGNTTYGAYGVGNKPLFLGSYNATSTANWTRAGGTGNIWNTSFSIPYDVGNIIFNSTSEFWSGFGSGNKTNSYEGLISEAEERAFYYDFTNNVISMYFSEGNPAEHHSRIEIARRKSEADVDMLNYSNINNLVIRDLDLRYYGQGGIVGIGTGNNMNHVYIINNSISWMGGVFHNSGTTLRFGNCIAISLQANHIYTKYNKAYQCHDSAYGGEAWTGAGSKNLTNIFFEYNIGSHSNIIFLYTNVEDSSGDINWTIKHNTFVNPGKEWSRNDRDSAGNPRVFEIRKTGSLTDNWNISNNIFYNSSSWNFVIGNFADTNWKGNRPEQDYNLYYNPSVAAIINFNATSYNTLALFQAGEGQETNGKEIDPLFADVLGGDFTPQSYQACVGSSTGSYVGAVPCDCVVPFENFLVNESVTFCPGTYYINDSGENGVIITNSHNIEIDCNHATFIGNESVNSQAVLNRGFTNITIKNCNISNYKYGIISQAWGATDDYNTTILNSEISYSTVTNILLININDSLIQNVTSHHAQGEHGIYISNDNYAQGDFSGIKIIDSSIYDNTRNGIQFNTAFSPILNVNVSNNYLYNNIQSGINDLGTDRAYFEDNYIYDNTRYAIVLSYNYEGGTSFLNASKNNIIQRNTIYGNGLADWDIRNYTLNNQFINNIYTNPVVYKPWILGTNYSINETSTQLTLSLPDSTYAYLNYPGQKDLRVTNNTIAINKPSTNWQVYNGTSLYLPCQHTDSCNISINPNEAWYFTIEDILGATLYADYNYMTEEKSTLQISESSKTLLGTSEDDFFFSLESLSTAVKVISSLLSIAVVIILFMEFLPKKNQSEINY